MSSRPTKTSSTTCPNSPDTINVILNTVKNLYSDTIVAPATTPGTGAISIVRVSGPQAFPIADAVVQLKSGNISQCDGYTIHFGEVFQEGKLLDQVLVSVFRAPHSYTGEDSVEISTHASAYIVTELIHLLTQAGARFAEPGEFTRRAFLNGKMDLAQAEAIADVISSSTAAAHRVAMNQLRGCFSDELMSLRSQLLEMASLLELELDFSEEDVEFADRKKLQDLVSGTLRHVEALAGTFHDGNLIKNGVPVAIVGATNAGKSTLLNALLGEERAIVSPIAGTTRDTIEETLTLGGIQFRFIDTAGIREADDSIEKMGIQRTFQKIESAEIILAVLDGASEESDLLNNLKAIVEKIKLHTQKLFVLLNKADKIEQNGVNKNVTLINTFVSSNNIEPVIISISAKTHSGLKELKEALLSAEQDLIPNADSTFITNERHFQALTQSASALRDVLTAMSSGLPSDLIAEDLRRALTAINSILGKDLLSPDDILHNIFKNHCIGK